MKKKISRFIPGGRTFLPPRPSIIKEHMFPKACNFLPRYTHYSVRFTPSYMEWYRILWKKAIPNWNLKSPNIPAELLLYNIPMEHHIVHINEKLFVKLEQ